REAGNHRMGSGHVSVWRLRRGRLPQTRIRPVLREKHIVQARLFDPRQNRRRGLEGRRAMNVVGIRGGTGLPVLLRGLSSLYEGGEIPTQIPAIVTVSDNGGWTGALREAFNMPAMGDIRKCMIALAGERSLLSSVCEHRFENPESFAGHP